MEEIQLRRQCDLAATNDVDQGGFTAPVDTNDGVAMAIAQVQRSVLGDGPALETDIEFFDKDVHDALPVAGGGMRHHRTGFLEPLDERLRTECFLCDLLCGLFGLVIRFLVSLAPTFTRHGFRLWSLFERSEKATE